MSSGIAAALAAANGRLAEVQNDDLAVNSAVLGLTRMFQGGPLSPVQDVNVLALTSSSAAFGMAGAVVQGNLHITDITDRDDLREAVVALRVAADIFEAVLREGAQ